MNLADLPVFAAVAAMICALLYRVTVPRRVIGERGEDDDAKVSPAQRTGIASVIAAVSAHVQAGGNATEAFEHQMGRGFATKTMTYVRIRAVLMRRRSDRETVRQVELISSELAAACALSERTGCPLSHCLDVVSADYRRLRMLLDLRRNAFAVPQATVSLLSVLPWGAVMFGELLGSHPLRFLTSTVQGNMCLVLGCSAYFLGVMWMRSMMRRAAM